MGKVKEFRMDCFDIVGETLYDMFGKLPGVEFVEVTTDYEFMEVLIERNGCDERYQVDVDELFDDSTWGIEGLLAKVNAEFEQVQQDIEAGAPEKSDGIIRQINSPIPMDEGIAFHICK